MCGLDFLRSVGTLGLLREKEEELDENQEQKEEKESQAEQRRKCKQGLLDIIGKIEGLWLSPSC